MTTITFILAYQNRVINSDKLRPVKSIRSKEWHLPDFFTCLTFNFFERSQNILKQQWNSATILFKMFAQYETNYNRDIDNRMDL